MAVNCELLSTAPKFSSVENALLQLEVYKEFEEPKVDVIFCGLDYFIFPCNHHNRVVWEDNEYELVLQLLSETEDYLIETINGIEFKEGTILSFNLRDHRYQICCFNLKLYRSQDTWNYLDCSEKLFGNIQHILLSNIVANLLATHFLNEYLKSLKYI